MPTAADSTDESRMDLVIRSPNHPRPIYVDVTIADATSVEALSKNAASRDGAAAEVLEYRKRQKYPNIEVVPFAIEAHGRLGESAVKLVKLIAPRGGKSARRPWLVCTRRSPRYCNARKRTRSFPRRNECRIPFTDVVEALFGCVSL